MEFFLNVLKMCLINLSISFVQSYEEESVSSLGAEEAYSKMFTDFNTTPSKANCPSLQNVSSLTQMQLIYRLTAPCRYDRLERPFPIFNNKCSSNPLHIFMRIHIYDIQVEDSNNLRLKIDGLIQIRYVDIRLDFGVFTPNRKLPIFGGSQLLQRIWSPHILLNNQELFSTFGNNEEDIVTTIMPGGRVVISSHIQPTLLCWISVTRFPFDDQHCLALLQSWMYNSSEVLLHWEEDSPIVLDKNTNLAGYTMQNILCNETMLEKRKADMRNEVLGWTFSSLRFMIYLTRDSEFYTMDYFVPSIMLVAISFVSFWLQADQTPARTTLGTSTMLSFITLTSNYESNFNRFSFQKLFKIWFFGCTFFIFGSMIEFAFVNTIWRRNNCLHLKKVSSKHIFKSTLTPKPIQQKSVFRCQSDGHLDRLATNICELQTNKMKLDVSETNDKRNTINQSKHTHHETLTMMTPQEVSLWIDRKSRFLFPLFFIIFNAIFWSFVFCL